MNKTSLIHSDHGMPDCIRIVIEGLLNDKDKLVIIREWDDIRKKRPFLFKPIKKVIKESENNGCQSVHKPHAISQDARH